MERQEILSEKIVLEEKRKQEIEQILARIDFSLLDKATILLHSNHPDCIYTYIKENEIKIEKDFLLCYIIILCQCKQLEEIKNLRIDDYNSVSTYEGYTDFLEELKTKAIDLGSGVEHILFLLLNESNAFYNKYKDKKKINYDYYTNLFFHLNELSQMQIISLVQNSMVMDFLENLYEKCYEDKRIVFRKSNLLMDFIGYAEEKYHYLLQYYKPQYIEMGSIKRLISNEYSRSYVYNEEYINDYDELSYDMDFFTNLKKEESALLVYYGRGKYAEFNPHRNMQLKRFLSMHYFFKEEELDTFVTLWFSKGTNINTGIFLLHVLNTNKLTPFLQQYKRIIKIIENTYNVRTLKELDYYKDYLICEALLLLEKYPSLVNDIIGKNHLTEKELFDLFVLLTKEDIPFIPFRMEDLSICVNTSSYKFEEKVSNKEISPNGGDEILFKYHRELFFLEEEKEVAEIDSESSHIQKFQDIGKKEYEIDLEKLHISGYDRALYLAYKKNLIIGSVEGNMVILYVPYTFSSSQLENLLAFLEIYDGERQRGEYQCSIVKDFGKDNKPIAISLKQGLFLNLTDLNRELYDFKENRDIEMKENYQKLA